MPLHVYFDASCPLCRTEMAALQARDRAGRLRLVDCSPTDFDGGPAPRAALMAAIHVVDAQGQLQIGVPAIRACRAAVGLPAGNGLFALPGVAPLAARAYALLARHRYRVPRWVVRLVAGREPPAWTPCAGTDRCQR